MIFTGVGYVRLRGGITGINIPSNTKNIGTYMQNPSTYMYILCTHLIDICT
jgi:hypothetical protein